MDLVDNPIIQGVEEVTTDNEQVTQVTQEQEDIQELQQSQVVQDQEQAGTSANITIRNDGDVVAADGTESLELDGRGVETILVKGFDPHAHGLDKNFRLTRFADVRRIFTVTEARLTKLLDGLIDPSSFTLPKLDGVIMEANIDEFPEQGFSLVNTVDWLYPLIEDPYMLGKIACAQVLSHLYAKGVTICDDLSILLSVPEKLTDKERDAIIPLILKGFKNAALEAKTELTSFEAEISPWLAIGGIAFSACQKTEFISSDNAMVGDILILTKPLGTTLATLVQQWLDIPEVWRRIKLVIKEDDVRKAYNRAINSMGRLNRNAARLMQKYEVHAATDVTNYGLLGHAQNLAKNQKAEVSFMIHTLPVISKMTAVDEACGNIFQLIQGLTPETSGGLLVCLPEEKAAAFCTEIKDQDGYEAWIVGTVEKGNRTARIIDKPHVIEVPTEEKDDDLW